MLKKFLLVGVILGICTCSVFAAYGTVIGYSLSSGQAVTNPDTGKQAYQMSTSAESIDESVYANYIQNLYAKTSIVDRNSGVIYKFGQITKHYVNYAEAFTSYIRDNSASRITADAKGLHRARYTDNTVSECTSSAGGMSMGGHSRANLNAIDDEKQIGADKRDELLAIADNTFNQSLSEYDYISFDDLWNDNFDADLQPLKSIVCDIFADAKEGDKVPLGVFYKGSTAFTVTEYADGSKALTQYDITPTAQQVQAINANDEAFHNDYIIVSRQEVK